MNLEAMKRLIAKYQYGHTDFVIRAETGERYYRNETDIMFKEKKSEEEKADRMLRTLYLYYRDNIDKLPKMYIDIINRDEEPKIERAICDYISGMSDTYSINTFRKIYIPMSWDI